MQKKSRLGLALGLGALLLLNIALYGPLFSPEQRPYRGSIAAGYEGITRFIAEHPNPWGWNPQQYAGQPTQFTYPPVLPYAASLVSWTTGMDPAWAFRCVVALLACLGPVTLALAFYWMFCSTRFAIAMGVAYSLFSPLYGLFERIDADKGLYYLPWRLLVLMKYGEGPHLAGLTILPLVIGVLVWGARRSDARSLIVMAAALAVTPLLNWLSAFALTIAIVVLLLLEWRLAGRIVLAGILGYGLACFWLTPEYVSTTLFNWPKDAYGYRLEQSHWPLYGGLISTTILIRVILGRARCEWHLHYLTLATWVFFWITAAYYAYQQDTIPESRRYAIEFELFLVAALGAWIRWLVKSAEGVERLCGVVCILALGAASLGQTRASLQRGWSDWGISDRERNLEYRLAQWLVGQKPQGRIFATGGLRFRLNSWAPLHQVGGTFESGLRNRIAIDHYYQVRTGEASKPEEEGRDALMELTAIGAQYVVVHGFESEEYYKDFKNPNKLRDLAPIVFAATKQDFVHQIPFESFAHLVKPNELPKHKYKEALPALYGAMTDQTRPKLKWTEEHPGRYRIDGSVRQGDEVYVSMNFDPGWRATQDGSAVLVRPNVLGLIQLDAKEKAGSRIILEYTGTTQQKIFAGISAFVWVASMALWRRSKRWTSKAST